MLDTVINGTRTSRSILGNLSIPEDWALARAQLVGEGWPIDFGPLNPAGLSQKGTDLNKSTLLSDETAALYGDELPENPTPDEVLALLWDKIYRLSTGKVKLSVTVSLSDGTPVPDVALSGITSVNGEQIFTDQNGRAVGYANAGSTTVTILDHLDITNTNKTITTTQGGAYTITLTPEKRNFLSLGSSKSLYISGLAKRVDVSVGGAGGGGGNGGGGGGGGGYTNTKENAAFNTRTQYTAQVGAPGNGATSSTPTRGGNSSFLGTSANGGNAGTNSSGGNGGTGNGNGGKGGPNYSSSGNYNGDPGTPGTGTVYSSFTQTIQWGGGGGGGSRATNGGGSGGAPGGGSGGSTNLPASLGSSGGGGGGGGRDGSASTYGANGGAGIVTARIWFEEDLTE